MRASRSSRRNAAGRGAAARTTVAPSRAVVERETTAELESWRARALPDATAPLGTDDLVRLFRDLVAALGLDASIAAGFSTNTVHYYRRKDIIDPPDGRTTAARYGVRHLWQIAGARLAGHLGLVTLAEARAALRGQDTRALVAFAAARVADARARDAVRILHPSPAAPEKPRPLPGRGSPAAAIATSRSLVVTLAGGALCIVPESHPALRSPEAARALGAALAEALGRPTT